MALDTRNRRASALGFKAPWRAVWPNPSGDIGEQAARQHMAFEYPGILAGEPPVPPAPTVLSGRVGLARDIEAAKVVYAQPKKPGRSGGRRRKAAGPPGLKPIRRVPITGPGRSEWAKGSGVHPRKLF